MIRNATRAGLCAATSAVTLCAATLAFAGQGQGPVAAACQDDIPKVCAGIEHGGGAVRRCLEAAKDKVSDACKQALATHGPGRGQGMSGGMGGQK